MARGYLMGVSRVQPADPGILTSAGNRAIVEMRTIPSAAEQSGPRRRLRYGVPGRRRRVSRSCHRLAHRIWPPLAGQRSERGVDWRNRGLCLLSRPHTWV
jgi:hypothetical protein